MNLIQHIRDRIQGKAPKGSRRSDQWPKVRAAWLKKHPECALCGGTEKLEVHHMVAFHLDPSRELDPKNFITLCEAKHNGVNCHLAWGHLGNFKKINPSVVKDAASWAPRFAAKVPGARSQ